MLSAAIKGTASKKQRVGLRYQQLVVFTDYFNREFYGYYRVTGLFS